MIGIDCNYLLCTGVHHVTLKRIAVEKRREEKKE